MSRVDQVQPLLVSIPEAVVLHIGGHEGVTAGIDGGHKAVGAATAAYGDFMDFFAAVAVAKTVAAQFLLNGGSFLVAREKDVNFKIEKLKGKHIIAGRKGGMPAMTLEWALNQNGVKTSEVNFDTSIDFASTTGAFIGGTGDYVSVFEPTALQLEKQGAGYVVASVGELGGTVPYTTYNAKKSYIEKNPDVIEGYTKAINKALEYTHTHTAKEVAEKITDYFPDTSLNDLTEIVQRYMDIDAWFKTTEISEEDFTHVQKIVKNAGELNKNAPFDKLVNNKYAKK